MLLHPLKIKKSLLFPKEIFSAQPEPDTYCHAITFKCPNNDERSRHLVSAQIFYIFLHFNLQNKEKAGRDLCQSHGNVI